MCSRKLSARLLLGLLAICFFPTLIAHGTQSAAAPDPGHFPTIQATSLDSARLNLPQGFSGKLNLVVISFAREQQREVDTWVQVAQQIQQTHRQVVYYELPTMSRENILTRWWFNSALRSDTTDKNLRGHILTAYVNKRKFLQSLHIASQKQAVAILVDQTGRVFWQASGPSTEQMKQSLQSALTANGV